MMDRDHNSMYGSSYRFKAVSQVDTGSQRQGGKILRSNEDREVKELGGEKR